MISLPKQVPAPTPDSITLAYVAGIVDGEGTISIFCRKNRYLVPYLAVSNTDLELLIWLRSMFMGNIYDYKEVRPNRKPCYQWVLLAKRAQAAIRLIMPYLRLKRRQAEIATSWEPLSAKLQKGDRIGAFRLTNADLIQKQGIISEMRMLNRRGTEVPNIPKIE